MANLAKFKEAARKFEQKEQWAKAIEQYVKAIEAFERSPEEEAELGLYNRLGDLYQKVGDAQSAVTYYERALDRYAEGGLANNAIALCNKILRIAPGRAQVYLKLGALFARKGFQAEAKQNLLEYADRMQKAGQLDEAFKALKKFAEMTPGQDDIWAVLAQQARAQATTPEAAEQVDKLLGEFEAKDQVVRRSRMSQRMVAGEELPGQPSPRTRELVFLDLSEPAPAPPGGLQPGALELGEAPPTEREIPALEIETTALATPEEAAPAAELPLMEIETTSLAGSQAAPPSAEMLALDIERTWLAEPEAAAPAEAAAAEATPAAVSGLPLLDVGAEESAVAPAEAGPPLEFLDLGRVSEAITAPSVEELEAHIAANQQDWEAHRQLGEALLERGERERGLGELDAALGGYDEAGDLETAYAVAEEMLRLDPNSVRYNQKRVELAYRQGDRTRLVDAYLELADALLRSNDPDKAVAVYRRVLEHDTANLRARSALETLAPPEAAAPAVGPGAPEPATVGAEYVDLGALLLDEEGPRDTRMRVGDEEPSGDEQKDFAEMLAAFKKGIAANVEEEDFQSHYDLGIAYKEMGLLDEAIAEFQKALRSPEGRLKSSEALGLCFFEKGQFAVAEAILRRALELPAASDGDRIGLLYWLGRTLEEQGKRQEALSSYNRVFAVDITFQDVNQRVQTLSRAEV